jgi:peptidyl-tRNA hydrolase
MKPYITNAVVALGNYTHPHTRHSAGQRALDYCAEKLFQNCSWNTENHGWIISEHICDLEKDSRKIIFFKPKEYMNLNGIPIRKMRI